MTETVPSGIDATRLRQFSGEVVINIVKTQPKVLVRGIPVENPNYAGPDDFLRSTVCDLPAS